jgi:hypothetical protein
LIAIPSFASTDPYSEGAAFAASAVLASDEQRVRFKCAVYATLGRLLGGTQESSVAFLQAIECTFANKVVAKEAELAETKAKLELAEATITTLREENAKLHSASFDTDVKLARLQKWACDLELSDERHRGSNIAITVRQLLNAP